jgi:hypothetical protein
LVPREQIQGGPFAQPLRNRSGPCLSRERPTTKIFAGTGVEDNSTQGYVGAGYAFGKGLLLAWLPPLAVGAFGGYNYKSALGDAGPTNFDGQDAFGAALLGYQFGAGPTTFRIFAGIEGEHQDITLTIPIFRARERDRIAASSRELVRSLRA